MVRVQIKADLSSVSNQLLLRHHRHNVYTIWPNLITGAKESIYQKHFSIHKRFLHPVCTQFQREHSKNILYVWHWSVILSYVTVDVGCTGANHLYKYKRNISRGHMTQGMRHISQALHHVLLHDNVQQWITTPLVLTRLFYENFHLRLTQERVNKVDVLIKIKIFKVKLNDGTSVITQEQVRASFGMKSGFKTARVHLLFFNQHVLLSTTYPSQSINNACSLKDPCSVKKDKWNTIGIKL